MSNMNILFVDWHRGRSCVGQVVGGARPYSESHSIWLRIPDSKHK